MNNQNVSLVRDRLEECVERLLVGPLNLKNPEEALTAPPSATYLTGILWPGGEFIDEEEQENIEQPENSSEDINGLPEQSAPLHSVMRPSSMGITLTVDRFNNDVTVLIEAGRYDERKAETTDEKVDMAGNNESSKSIWCRKQVRYYYTFKTSATRKAFRINKFQLDDGLETEDNGISLHVVQRPVDGHCVITLTMINTASKDSRRDEASLFQTKLSAKIKSPGIVISRLNTFKSGDEDQSSNDLIYNHAKEYATGHGVASVWKMDKNDPVTEISSCWLPNAIVPDVSSSGHRNLDDLKNSDQSPFSAHFLSVEGEKESILKKLSSFTEIYERWLSEKVDQIKELDSTLVETAEIHIELCDQALERMRNGIGYLNKNDTAWKAFCLANKVMDLQAQSPLKLDRKAPLIWRPFQLAFLLLCIESTAESDCEDRDCMDLLWFPTGGGKTEAYLALTAFAIFYTRLTDPVVRINGAVNVIMRYTLRLLTVQQFQRAAEMICQAEIIRLKHPEELGKSPISLGLWVGSGSTPNRLSGGDSAESALEKERRGEKPESTPRLLLKCPVCGNDLRTKDYSVDSVNKKMTIRCSNSDCETFGNSLPVHTVDEEIYKVKPSLLLGTVDKFAQLPRNANTGRLFGIPDCPPPSLIIQDELHLITGPLGTICGLYESVVDMICSRNGKKPKIIGSTATIGRARQQIKALFNRSVMLFPPPALDSRDSFFAVEDNSSPGRLYIGLSSAGRSPKFALQAIAASLLQAAGSIYEKENGVPDTLKNLDPYWTLALYFNSLRELGGAKVMVSDDIPRSIRFYANKLKSSPRPIENQEELTSRVSSVEIPEKLEKLSITLETDILQGTPLDVLLASNMISVGMDIPRLGLLIVNGQPKTTAEYIQATSRVGRTHPGIIFVVFNSGRPRDLSHFEHFSGYHTALYRSVEATSVTPWSPRARDKALHAVFASAVRHLVSDMKDDGDAIKFDPDDTEVELIVEKLLSRAATSEFPVNLEDIERQIRLLESHWKRMADSHKKDAQKFEYFARRAPYRQQPINPHLMRAAEEVFDDHGMIWRTPNSMREVEPSSCFTLWE